MKFKDLFPAGGSKLAKLNEQLAQNAPLDVVEITEHETYQRIPGTQNWYRIDSGSTHKMTVKHAHVYAKKGGGGKELYSVNIDGRGHDGSSGIEIPSNDADHLRRKGFNIPPSNILEQKASLDGLTAVFVGTVEELHG